jgi:hypothetical protein
MIAALLIVLLGAFLRFHQLDGKSIWFDEGYTYIDSMRPVSEIWRARQFSFDLPPLSFVLVNASLRLFGDNDFALRLPFTLASILSIPLLAWLGRELLGTRVGLLAMFLFALAPMGVHYGQEARPYALLTLFSLAATLALWKALQTERLWWLAVFAVATILNLYTSYLVVLLLGAQIVFTFFWLVKNERLRDKRLWLSLIGTLLVVLVLFVPQLSVLPDVVGRRGEGAGLGQLRSDIVSNFPNNRSLVSEAFRWFNLYGSPDATILLTVSLLVGVAHAFARRRERLEVTYLLHLLILPVLALLLNPRHAVGSRYFTLVLPAYLLLVARGLSIITAWLVESFEVQTARRQWLLNGAMWAGLCVVLLVLHRAPLRDYYQSVPGYERDKADFEGVARYLQENWKPGELILAGSSSGWVGMQRYLPAVWPHSTEFIQQVVESGRSGYLIDDVGVYRGRGHPDFLPRADDWLAQRATVVQDWVGVRVYRFGNPAATVPGAIKIDLRDIPLRAMYTGRRFPAQGWSTSLYTADGQQWALTTGRSSVLQLLLKPDSAYMMSFNVRPLIDVSHRLTVRVNGQALTTTEIAPGTQRVELLIPAPVVLPGLNTVEIEHEPTGAVEETFRVIGQTGVTSPVGIKVRSVAADLGNFADIYVGDELYSYSIAGRGYGRGYTVVVLDEAGGVEKWDAFDTDASPEASQRMAEFIGTVPEGRIVIATTLDDAAASLTDEGVAALASIGGAVDLRGKFRWMHSIVGVKGAPPGAAAEQLDEQETTLLLGADPQAEVLLIDTVTFSPAQRTALLPNGTDGE